MEIAAPPVLLVTRPQPEADAFANMARAAGFAPIVTPVLRGARVAHSVSAAAFGALVFTSANGVRFCGIDAFKGPVFAVGDATATAARRAGFKDVRAAGGDGQTLVNAILRAGTSGPVLHLSGAHVQADVAAALREQGIPAERIIVYAMQPEEALSEDATAALRRGSVFVSLFSRRAAEVFLELTRRAALFERLAACRAVCLSAKVAAAAGAATWGEIVSARRPSAAALLDTARESKP